MTNFKTLRRPINLVFLIQVVVIFLVAFGVWPRVLIIPLTALIAIFILRADLETSTAFFIRSVPIFVAIPFTSYFDSFNIWRIAAGLIFLKWFWDFKKGATTSLLQFIGDKSDAKKGRGRPLLVLWVSMFFLFSLLSLLAAEDLFAGIKRIIYLINLGFVPVVIYDLVKKNHELAKKFLSSILISGVIVAGVGLAQLFSAYLMDLYAFLGFWGDSVQLGFYGSQWAHIAVEANTWFAYFDTQLSLRVFSTFPDSHSFPVYLLMTIPALLALALSRVFTQTGQRPSGNSFVRVPSNKTMFPEVSRDFKKIMCIRASWLIVLLPIFYLLAILSGTRGIWLAVLAPLLALPFLIKKTKHTEGKSILKYLGLLLLPFLILFAMAFPIMGSDQFGLQKVDNQILGKRLRSIIDLEETSNNGRVEIWKKTVESIIRRPLLGVGISNFPIVLSQHTDLAKAGSSAHNLYLHIAAEIGLVGLLAALGILSIILKRGWVIFTGTSAIHPLENSRATSRGSRVDGMADLPYIKIYSAAFILYSLWVLFYSLTDAIMFDERIFLVFAINSALILGLHKNVQSSGHS